MLFRGWKSFFYVINPFIKYFSRSRASGRRCDPFPCPSEQKNEGTGKKAEQRKRQCDQPLGARHQQYTARQPPRNESDSRRGKGKPAEPPEIRVISDEDHCHSRRQRIQQVPEKERNKPRRIGTPSAGRKMKDPESVPQQGKKHARRGGKDQIPPVGILRNEHQRNSPERSPFFSPFFVSFSSRR